MRMSLLDDAQLLRTRFETVGSDELLSLLDRISAELRTDDTRDYLRAKIESIRHAAESERKTMCKDLIPYMDWYISSAT